MPEEHQCRGEEVPTVADERIFVSMTGKCSGRLGQFQREHEGTQEGNSMATIGLYHPFIHFKDDDWLKLSALYWDRMARIVPIATGAIRYDGACEGLVSYACPY